MSKRVLFLVLSICFAFVSFCTINSFDKGTTLSKEEMKMSYGGCSGMLGVCEGGCKGLPNEELCAPGHDSCNDYLYAEFDCSQGPPWLYGGVCVCLDEEGENVWIVHWYC